MASFADQAEELRSWLEGWIGALAFPAVVCVALPILVVAVKKWYDLARDKGTQRQ
jgi:hypothetical protein